ncbi:MAG: arginine--tRNA ligase [Lachnospiraceae bacterium]|jgi:arginyl-tRNA synthetase|nr:arginine--tRNA ligase [Lachnospiraceae bacterium]
MNHFLEEISSEVRGAFAVLGYRSELGKVTVSNRLDLCELQCNGAMAAAREYQKPPLTIAAEVAERLQGNSVFAAVEVVAPGFLNLDVSARYVRDYVIRMGAATKLGVKSVKPQKVIVDYGGANVAKPLHVGHLRSAIIGESIRRIISYAGHDTVGDIHLGDWGLQMGLIIHELKQRHPQWVYFDPLYPQSQDKAGSGEEPQEALFTLADLAEIYPLASEKSKNDSDYREQAQAATHELQSGHRGYRAIWQQIMEVSLTDLRRVYDGLDVSFDLWKGESDVQEYIADMIAGLINDGFAKESDGALIIDVSTATDSKEIPPCLIRKSDGASLYMTTDLATVLDRVKEINPDAMVYITDKRQNMHFEQLFRCIRKVGMVKPEMELTHLGIGTMNGNDGKPFKTRDGGVMRLEELVAEINEKMYQRIIPNQTMSEEEARETARVVGLAALKYGDLSNQAGKDYVFDIDRFTSFEGDTGPYILYTIVRIKSIMAKCALADGEAGEERIILSYLRYLDEEEAAVRTGAKTLLLALAGFSAMVEAAYQEIAPHRVAAYTYQLANAFNMFYHETKILTESVNEKRRAYLALLAITKMVLETCIDLLGFSAPERM